MQQSAIASPIRLFDVAKKTSGLLVFSLVLLNQPQLNTRKIKETRNKITKKCLVLGFFWWAGIILKRDPRFGFSCSLKTHFLIILQISPMGGDRFSFQFYPSKILIDYFLISELAFIIHPKIKRSRVVRIVKRRAGFCQ